MLRTKGIKRNRMPSRDDYSEILIERKKKRLDVLIHELAEQHNPKLMTILKVEDLFKKYIEFDSRSQLMRKLEGSVKAPVLNTVIARLVSENKVVFNNDHSLTWINTESNEKLNREFEKAISI